MNHPPAPKDPNCRIGWVTNKKTGSKFYNLPPAAKHPLQCVVNKAAEYLHNYDCTAIGYFIARQDGSFITHWHSVPFREADLLGGASALQYDIASMRDDIPVI